MLHENHAVIDIVLSDIQHAQDGRLDAAAKKSARRALICALSWSRPTVTSDNIRTAMNNGAFDFITKPINFQDMEKTIQRSYQNLNQMREALRSRDDLLVLKKELNLAHKIQKSILPQDFNIHKSCDIHAFMNSCEGGWG